jgi:hypothetical protein
VRAASALSFPSSEHPVTHTHANEPTLLKKNAYASFDGTLALQDLLADAQHLGPAHEEAIQAQVQRHANA